MRQFFLLSLILLTACGEMPKQEASAPSPSSSSSSSIGDYISPYRLDIRQGNFVTQDMVTQLKPGLSREQVRYVLGTPLVTDPFHDNRWDYVYRYDSGKGDVQQRKLSVYFEDNKLARVAGDVGATDPNAAQSEPAKPREVNIPPAAGSEAAKAAEAAKATAAPVPTPKE
jgi:outer membrane protein assembly factor BamE